MSQGKNYPLSALSLQKSLLIEGDSLAVLRLLPEKSVQCVITSPPYWGLRDYNVRGQIGLESSMYEYIENLRVIFEEVKRVLRDDGILWVNVGDGYTSGNRTYRAQDSKNPARAMTMRPGTPKGLKPKDLQGIPWRLAFALQDSGWFLRSDIIWHKPNAMPESVRDRPTRAHEYLFMFSKSEQYYYNYKMIREMGSHGKRRNKRSVWTVNTQAFSGAHFATFPPELILPCVLASTKTGDYVLDPFFGSGTVGVVCWTEGRKYLGIELNPEYVALAANRLMMEEASVIKVAI